MKPSQYLMYGSVAQRKATATDRIPKLSFAKTPSGPQMVDLSGLSGHTLGS
jgi:hypothetical protein